ncbi:MAG: D-alanine--D-alanine ligase [Planctomycetota bacterium]
MKVMVLAGGPDREREVSLQSGKQVAAALREAGHEVIQRDMGPDDLAALDEFALWSAEAPEGGAVFPIFHGRWGEGGPAQMILDERGVRYVGCREAAARLCFDKTKTKQVLKDAGLPTPDFELVNAVEKPTLTPPVVVKPNDEGSSIDLEICHTADQLDKAWAGLSPRHDALLVERFVAGRELTVGVIEDPDNRGCVRALPPIQIVPATDFYDYEAKYVRDDTQYRFDFAPHDLDQTLRDLACDTFTALGCRHLARVDLFLDESDRPWIIEVNTLPGFTSHSLLPMAARKSGLSMPALVDRLVRLAKGDGG